MLLIRDAELRVAATVAPVLLGSCLSCVTCGLLLSLVARYWAIFGGDAWYVRAAVVLSAVYAFADTAINCTWTYRVSPETVPTELSQRVLTLESVQWAVSDFMRPLDLAQLPWQVTSFCIFLGTTAWAVQNFYLARLYFLSRRNWIICLPIGLIIYANLGISLYIAHYCSQHDDIAAAFEHLTHFISPWMASALATDLATLLGILWYMQPKCPLAGRINWSQVPRKIMQTNTPSTLFQLAIVCLHYRVHTGLGFLYLGFCSSKIYLGTFIATCNARDPHGSLSFDETIDTCRLKGLGPSKLPPVHVAILQERRVDGDDDVSSTAVDDLNPGGKGGKGGKPEADLPSPRESVQFHLKPGTAASLPPDEQHTV